MKKWEKAQRAVAEGVGGWETPGSGNKWGYPGDVSSSRWLIEVKDTGKKTYQLAAPTWVKIQDEARFAGKDPAWVISFDGQPFVALIPEDFLPGLCMSMEARKNTIYPQQLKDYWYEPCAYQRVVIFTVGGEKLAAIPYYVFLEME